MEMIVVYNHGKSARLNGAPRIAPAEIDYPIVSRYQEHHTECVALNDTAKREWLAGYDGKYDRKSGMRR